uniref:G-protein coupled receptors family 1 profile domain-containing protein n=1 Tax=Meloidogyne incognita TaxID=6306 RepID=A0A914KR60_MELIC
MSKSVYNLVLLFTATKAAFSIPAIILNCSLIYVTIKSKCLRKGLCNWLLAIYDGCLVVYLATFPLALFQHLLTKSDLMPFWKCFLLQSVPLTLFAASFPFMLAIALDRFIGAVFPLKYKSLKNPYYIGAVFFACGFYATFYFAISVSNLIRYYKSSISCSMINLLLSYQRIMAMTNILLEAIAIALYIGIAIIISRRKFAIKKLNESSFDRRIFVSLFSIAAFDFIGWTSNSSLYKLFDIYFGLFKCSATLLFQASLT